MNVLRHVLLKCMLIILYGRKAITNVLNLLFTTMYEDETNIIFGRTSYNKCIITKRRSFLPYPIRGYFG